MKYNPFTKFSYFLINNKKPQEQKFYFRNVDQKPEIKDLGKMKRLLGVKMKRF